MDLVHDVTAPRYVHSRVSQVTSHTIATRKYSNTRACVYACVTLAIVLLMSPHAMFQGVAEILPYKLLFHYLASNMRLNHTYFGILGVNVA